MLGIRNDYHWQKFGFVINKYYNDDKTYRIKWYQSRIRFYKCGDYKMHVGMNIDFLKSYYIIGCKVPFAKFVNRKKYARIVEETNQRNIKFDLFDNDASYVDDYGSVHM